MKFQHLLIPFCFILLACIVFAGCTAKDASPGSPVPATTGPAGSGPGPQVPAKMPASVPYSDPLLGNATAIPVIAKGVNWEMAKGCGFTESDLPKAASLLMSNCQARQLVRDGGRITGIGYDMNFLGNRCRTTTHPDADPATCSFCADAGPTLSIEYREMTVEYIAHPGQGTVSQLSASLPEGTVSVSENGTDSVIFRENKTVFYAFNETLNSAICSP